MRRLDIYSRNCFVRARVLCSEAAYFPEENWHKTVTMAEVHLLPGKWFILTSSKRNILTGRST